MTIIFLYTILYNYGMLVFEGENYSIFRSFQTVVETMTTTGYGADSPWETPVMNMFVVFMQVSGIAIGFFTHAVPGPNVNALTATGKTRLIMWDNLAAGDTNIVLNVLLIPQYGLLGAAIATAVAYGGLNLLYSVQLYRLTGIHPVTLSLLKPATAGLASMLVIYAIVTTLLWRSVPVLISPPSGTVTFLVSPVAGCS
jgi:Na+-driven multidrug efflux pump